LGLVVLFVAACSSAGDSNPPPTGYKYYAYVAGGDSLSKHVYAFAINIATGALTAVAGSPFDAEWGPNFVAVDPSGKFAYVGNSSSFYFSDNVSAFSINARTGALKAVASSPFAAYSWPNSIAVDPSGKFAYVAHGIYAYISAFTINTVTGALTAVAGSPFGTAGAPYSIAVDPSGKFAYTANDSNNVSALTVNAVTGALTVIGGSPFAAGQNPESVMVDPSGKFVYVANRGSNDVSAFTIDAVTGALTVVAGSPFSVGMGPVPMNPVSVCVDPSGKFVYTANHNSDNVSAFTIDAVTGALTAIAGSPFAAGGMNPHSIKVDPSGKFAYMANAGSNNVSVFSISPATGALTAVAGSPFAAISASGEIAVARIAQ